MGRAWSSKVISASPAQVPENAARAMPTAPAGNPPGGPGSVPASASASGAGIRPSTSVTSIRPTGRPSPSTTGNSLIFRAGQYRHRVGHPRAQGDRQRMRGHQPPDRPVQLGVAAALEEPGQIAIGKNPREPAVGADEHDRAGPAAGHAQVHEDLADGLPVAGHPALLPAAACGAPPWPVCGPGCPPDESGRNPRRRNCGCWLVTRAKASPRASMAVVLLLGASPRASASSNGPSSKHHGGRPAQRAVGPAGDRHDRHAQLGQRGQQPQHFLRLAALREDQHQVVAMDAAQVAMHGLGRMEAMAAGAGRGQRGHDLLADQSGFAHPGDDHAAAAARAKTSAKSSANSATSSSIATPRPTRTGGSRKNCS